MPRQLPLRFDDIPISCQAQRRYHAIAPVLAGRSSPAERARDLDLSYQTVTRWLRRFRDGGMPGLLTAPRHPREPYTPERVVVALLYYKCCVPAAADRELARVVASATGHRLRHKTVAALLARFFLWRHAEFRDLVRYPAPEGRRERRAEMVRLHHQGWGAGSIATLLRCHRNTVGKWLGRWGREAVRPAPGEGWLLDVSRAPREPRRKVYLGAIHATLELQKKYGYADWFRIRGYLSRDYGIELGQTSVKKIMRLNRRLHLAPARPAVVAFKEVREGPPASRRPFEHAYIDIRYLDAKPEGVQLYSCLLLEGFSRTILAGSLTRRQDLGVVLRVYYLALLSWGCWDELISDHGTQFQAEAFARVNGRLRIRHTMYEKGHPWQSLLESQFGIRARVGEYGWARCGSVEAAAELHRDLIRDHNRLPHYAHRKRADGKLAPLEVLGGARGREADAETLHRAFSRRTWQRRTDAKGFVRVGRWRVYVEEGLPLTPVQLIYWEGRLRAEYGERTLAEYHCRWDEGAGRPSALRRFRHYETDYSLRQRELFDPLWERDPVEEGLRNRRRRRSTRGRQLSLYLGPKPLG